MSTVTWFCLPHKWVVTIQVQRELANKSLCFFAGVTVIREYRIMASPGENVNMLQKDLPFNPLLLWFAMWSEQWQKIDLNRYKDEVKQDELPVFHRLVDPLVGCNWRRIWIALHCSSELLRSVDDARTFSHLMNYGGRLDSEASIQDKDSNRFFEKGRRFFPRAIICY